MRDSNSYLIAISQKSGKKLENVELELDRSENYGEDHLRYLVTSPGLALHDDIIHLIT